jgi:hypothetical protein
MLCPKGIMEMYENDIMRINKKGIDFIEDYIETHPFYESVYNISIAMREVILG